MTDYSKRLLATFGIICLMLGSVLAVEYFTHFIPVEPETPAQTK